MTSIALPTTPGIQSAKPRLLDFGGVLTSPLGGATQKLNRLGNRFAVDFQMPPMWTEPNGRIWVSRLSQAQSVGALAPFPQPNLAVGSPGSPLVNGAGQTGSVLAIDGFTAGYLIREGQFFSVIVASRRYLYMATADTTATSGSASVPIAPMLRVSPTDNAVCEFAQPMIEGWLSGDNMGWELPLEPVTNIAFTITEAQ